MKPVYENIENIRGGECFVAYDYQTDHFPFKWHYHPEYELTLITGGSGKRLVGDSYEDFAPNDLVLLGNNLPHTWVNEPLSQHSAAVVIQFSKEFIAPFLTCLECNNISILLNKSKYGLRFKNTVPPFIIERIRYLPKVTGVAKLTGLVELLDLLSNLPTVKLCSSLKNISQINDETEQRINIVCNYVYQHYNKHLSPAQVAKLIHLSPAAFCKFFKKTTGKLFSDYVNDIRISRACTLLVESDKSITSIAYAAGYESITYFNRIFHRKKTLTPREFRAKLKEYGNYL